MLRPFRRARERPAQAGLGAAARRANLHGSFRWRRPWFASEGAEGAAIRRVYVVDDKGKVSIRSVELGPEVGTLRVITQGLKPKERIAVDAIRLRPGMTIDPKPVAANPTDVKEPGAKPAPAAGA